MKTCRNCSAPVEVVYCSTCGQRYVAIPFTFGRIFEWALDLLDFNKGYFWTLYHLILKPNRLITDFLNGKTKNYVNPVKFILINLAAIFILAMGVSYLEHDQKGKEGDGEWIMYLLAAMYVGLTYIFNLLFFLKSKYNKLEQLIIVAYESCVFIVLAFPMGVLISIYKEFDEIFYVISLWAFLTILYHSFYLKKIFGGNTILVLLKAILSIVGSFLIMSIIASTFDLFGT